MEERGWGGGGGGVIFLGAFVVVVVVRHCAHLIGYVYGIPIGEDLPFV